MFKINASYLQNEKIFIFTLSIIESNNIYKKIKYFIKHYLK